MVERYEHGIAVMQKALQGVSAKLLDVPPAPGKWTIRQIAAHVADADLVSSARFRWIAAQPGSPLPSWDQEIWTEKLAYTRQPVEQSLAAIAAIRRYTAAMLRHLPAAAWQQSGQHSEKGEVTLLAQVEYMAGHAENHARQIEAIRQKGASAN